MPCINLGAWHKLYVADESGGFSSWRGTVEQDKGPVQQTAAAQTKKAATEEEAAFQINGVFFPPSAFAAFRRAYDEEAYV